MLLHIKSVTEREVKTVIVALGSISFIEFEYSINHVNEELQEMCIHFKGNTPDLNIKSDDSKSLAFNICEYNDLKKAAYSSDNIKEFESDYLLAIAGYLDRTELEYMPQ